MARRFRLQYPGARYHVINRGNPQHEVFGAAGAKHAFLVTLGEAAVQFGWRANAFVIMRNHYHLALKTPEPNLVAGMHCLQIDHSRSG
jgi:putative transposase